MQGERIVEVGRGHASGRRRDHRPRRPDAAARPDRRARPPVSASRRRRSADRRGIRPAAHHHGRAGRARRPDGRLHRRARHGHRRRRLGRHRGAQRHQPGPDSRPAPAHQRQRHRHSRRPRRRHRLQPRAARASQRHLRQQRRRTGDRDPPAVQGRRGLHQDLRNRRATRARRPLLDAVSVHRGRTGRRRAAKPRAWASASPCTPPANRARSMPRGPAWSPSITPTSSATRPCGSCARSRSSPCPRSPSPSTSPTRRHTRTRPRASASLLDFHAREFRKQLAAGVPFAVGSDVGPFPHGTQAREFC